MYNSVLCWLVLLGLCGCANAPLESPPRQAGPADDMVLADLPRPVANNAVASVMLDERILVFSFLGLGAGKTWQDTRSDAWLLELPGSNAGQGQTMGNWRQLADVPGSVGRLAATATGVLGKVYIFGGYTVAEDGSEKSVPLVHALDSQTLTYKELQQMPVPVDDTVSLVYKDRYIYLISGWHDTDNVDLVQVYDIQENSWFNASAYPGPAVFGHAGGIVNNEMVICDGVKVVPAADGKRSFVASGLCYAGTIDPERPEIINWRSIAHYPHAARYRMAAGAASGKIYFAGGSDNPYNYDGVGYNGIASLPSAAVFAWDADADAWSQVNDLPFASMDHRGLVSLGNAYANGFALVGGMDADGTVLARTVFYKPE